MADLMRCRWCGKDRRRPSDWEQQNLSGEWQRLCVRCANRRVANPWSALLAMRRVGVHDDAPSSP